MAVERSVQIFVNGFEGPRCTVEASTEWTVRQVQQAICEKLNIPVEGQTLIKEREKLFSEATVGSLLPDEAVSSLQLLLVVQEVRPINFVGLRHGLEQIAPGRLQGFGRGAFGMLTTAVSSDGLVVGEGRGLRFRPGTTDKNFFLGLGTRSSAPEDFSEIDHAVCCGADGRFCVYESGAKKFDGGGGSYTAISQVELLVHADRVEFFVGGLLKHISQRRCATECLFAMADFVDAGAEALEIQWL